jgi:hypothetical protein
MLNRQGSIRWSRIFLIGLAFGGLYALGQFVTNIVVDEFDVVLHVRSEPMFHRLILTAAAAYILLLAIPFMPGAEIGITMILVLGPKICFLVYVCTVFALIPPFLIGRLIPSRYCVRLLAFLGLDRLKRLMEEIAPLTADERLSFLVKNAPARFIPFLLRHRFVALAVVVNLPGNSLIGGGGGIALFAGITGLYPFPAYVLTVAIAVAPVPLLISLTDLRF